MATIEARCAQFFFGKFIERGIAGHFIAQIIHQFLKILVGIEGDFHDFKRLGQSGRFTGKHKCEGRRQQRGAASQRRNLYTRPNGKSLPHEHKRLRQPHDQYTHGERQGKTGFQKIAVVIIFCRKEAN
ncbi:hypothetical protein DWB58_04800 [candidate division KSB1 bacterium]|nr:hypothetical protein [candidate division KSB1 bacterium]